MKACVSCSAEKDRTGSRSSKCSMGAFSKGYEITEWVHVDGRWFNREGGVSLQERGGHGCSEIESTALRSDYNCGWFTLSLHEDGVR